MTEMVNVEISCQSCGGVISVQRGDCRHDIEEIIREVGRAHSAEYGANCDGTLDIRLLDPWDSHDLNPESSRRHIPGMRASETVARSLVRRMFPVMEEGMCGKINGSWDGRQWARNACTGDERALLAEILGDG